MTPHELETLAHLRRARDLIDREFARPLDVPALARHALMSPGHFSRQFRAAYGETPYNYLMTRRIERSMALLRGGMSVTDACMEVGCTSLGSFSSRFTEVVGETPSSYRAREHDAVEAMPPCVAKHRTRPIKTPPIKTPPAKAASPETVPAQTAPAQTAPAEAASAEAASAEAALAETGPGETRPGEAPVTGDGAPITIGEAGRATAV